MRIASFTATAALLLAALPAQAQEPEPAPRPAPRPEWRFRMQGPEVRVRIPEFRMRMNRVPEFRFRMRQAPSLRFRLEANRMRTLDRQLQRGFATQERAMERLRDRLERLPMRQPMLRRRPFRDI